jgi:DNA polymerase-3 subunit epsilon/CBS domain-containing protein
MSTALIRQTALSALDAVVIDTETTGLDPKQARLIEIGAIRLDGERLDPSETLSVLVRPDIPVPASATAIHGIDDAMLAKAENFAVIGPQLARFLRGRPLIGHSIGFDLAVFGKAHAQAGLSWAAPLALDTRLLAQIVMPSLANYSLEALASLFGLSLDDRHRALADARLTGEIFLKLVPKLKEAGIRTLGEALTASRRLTQALEDYHRAGWIEPAAATGREGPIRLDSYPYRHRVRDVMSHPPVTVGPEASLKSVLDLMATRRISSVFVGEAGGPAKDTGILTERDLLRAISQRGPDCLLEPAAQLMTHPLVTIGDTDFVYRAIGRMGARAIRHLAVENAAGHVVGALSARDLLRLRASDAIALGDDLTRATSVTELTRAWAKLPAVVASLMAEDIVVREIAGIIAEELIALTARVTELAVEDLAADGHGAPPCAFAILVLGSAGRGESLLAMDQDHALVFAEGEPDGPEDRWFARLGAAIARKLDNIGVPLCKGGVMASEAAFRGSLATWLARIEGWVSRASPQDLLNVDIFFDFRPAFGDMTLTERLWHDAWAAPRGAFAFLKLLGETHAAAPVPTTLMGRLKLTEGRLDLKRHGLLTIVSQTRLLALRHGIAERSTAARLKGLIEANVGGRDDLAAFDAIHERLLKLILAGQLADIAAGQPPGTHVPGDIIERHGGQTPLRDDLRRLAHYPDLARDQLSSA